MSDYGFATKDQNGDNAINAKNPIFGFDMGHRPMAAARRPRTRNRLIRGVMTKHNRPAKSLKHY